MKNSIKMKTTFSQILIFGIILLNNTSYADGFIEDAPAILIFGPRFNYQIGSSNTFWNKISIGFEASYWRNYVWGVDVGMELGKNKFILFSEAQLGIIVLGASTGPFINLLDKKMKVGWQITAWANTLAGIHYRKRMLYHENEYFLGLYLTGFPMLWNTDNYPGGSDYDPDDFMIE